MSPRHQVVTAIPEPIPQAAAGPGQPGRAAHRGPGLPGTRRDPDPVSPRATTWRLEDRDRRRSGQFVSVVAGGGACRATGSGAVAVATRWCLPAGGQRRQVRRGGGAGAGAGFGFGFGL